LSPCSCESPWSQATASPRKEKLRVELHRCLKAAFEITDGRAKPGVLARKCRTTVLSVVATRGRSRRERRAKSDDLSDVLAELLEVVAHRNHELVGIGAIDDAVVIA